MHTYKENRFSGDSPAIPVMNEFRRLAGLPALESRPVEPTSEDTKYLGTAVSAIDGGRDPHATLERQFPELSDDDVEHWVERALEEVGFGRSAPKVK